MEKTLIASKKIYELDRSFFVMCCVMYLKLIIENRDICTIENN